MMRNTCKSKFFGGISQIATEQTANSSEEWNESSEEWNESSEEFPVCSVENFNFLRRKPD
jgi:hypothetical protein